MTQLKPELNIEDIAKPASLRQDEIHPDHWTLNFGPQHPATHTTIHLVLTLDGERVIHCDPNIGYLHSGFEKLAEHHTYDQYVTVTDRMNYLSPIANNVAWHHAVEKLLNIELTPRCKYMRTIVCELARIQDHLLSAGELGLETGAFTAFLYAFNQRETIYDLLEALCGARFTTSWTRTGGAMSDAPDGWFDYLNRFLDDELPIACDEFNRLLIRNRIFLERSVGIGVITKEEAINWGWSGPAARGSGVRRDIRKDEPYLAYAEVDFKVPIATAGDVFSRFQVRIAELQESIKIIKQCIKQMPGGPIDVEPDERVAQINKGEAYGSIEGLIHHFETVMSNRGFVTPVAESYGCIEAPNGELGFFLVGDGTHVPWRCKTRGPSFIHLQALNKLVCGHTLSEIVVSLASLNVIAAELDG